MPDFSFVPQGRHVSIVRIQNAERDMNVWEAHRLKVRLYNARKCNEAHSSSKLVRDVHVKSCGGLCV